MLDELAPLRLGPLPGFEGFRVVHLGLPREFEFKAGE
jgi:hypothetical protein